MPLHTLYEKYKQDTNFFLSWLVNEYNLLVISQRNTPGSTQNVRPCASPSVDQYINLATFLAEKNQNVPHHVFSALNSAIAKRVSATASYTVLQGTTLDSQVQESNRKHQHFTDVLQRCFQILGGDNWNPTITAAQAQPSIAEIQQDFTNRFKALKVQSNEALSDEEEEPSSSRPDSSRRAGKGKGRGKGGKGKKAGKQSAREVPVYEAIPIERLRAGQDQMAEDYLLAVYSAVQQWIELRDFIQNLWRGVAYIGHNSAVVAATSKVAISMVERTNAAIFIDFPGNDSYLTIVKALVRGDVDEAQGMFEVDIADITGRKSTKTVLDIKEQLLYNTYKDLRDFIRDYRHARGGRLTAKMKRRIGEFNPEEDLKKVGESGQLARRRSYTMRWLYDLVNVYSAAKLKKNRELPASRQQDLEDIDWASGNVRTLFGLNEFAAQITRIAMQPPNSELDGMIYPHHVFQLQCIVDSFTVSRGWVIHITTGPTFDKPAKSPATRDVEVFLDRKRKKVSGGYHLSVDAMCTKLKETCEDFDYLTSILQYILTSEEDFRNYVGTHMYAKGEGHWKGVETSRFGPEDADGLHKYSPFLCGAGLEEALSISFKQMMSLWQEMREPLLLLHMYRFLKQNRYLTGPIDLWESLEILFKGCVFPADAYQNSTMNSARTLSTLQNMQRQASSGTRFVDQGRDIHELFDLEKCRNFNRESSLTAFRKKEWNFETAPPLDISSDQDLAVLSSTGTKHGGRIEVRRIKPLQTGGNSYTQPPMAQPAGQSNTTQTTTQPTTAQATVPDPAPPTPGPSTSGQQNSPGPAPASAIEYRDVDMVTYANADFLDDICGFSSLTPSRPLSGINYPILTYYILDVFAEVEKRLEAEQNILYATYFKIQTGQNTNKRGSMYLMALNKNDESPSIQLLRTMADVLEREDRRIWEFTYWEDRDREVKEEDEEEDRKDNDEEGNKKDNEGQGKKKKKKNKNKKKNKQEMSDVG
ncbi:hypothetical protein FLONG3_6020 [Fusarium longipes]|uniref:DUF6604 domain-containing protein n=1 Tax=Fusarium longipes TaxID=694270 RepID=A0A395SPS1_9HYPO|nr:hypothetical protein FLONG3_6020 [Fusarium longipes]